MAIVNKHLQGSVVHSRGSADNLFVKCRHLGEVRGIRGEVRPGSVRRPSYRQLRRGQGLRLRRREVRSRDGSVARPWNVRRGVVRPGPKGSSLFDVGLQ